MYAVQEKFALQLYIHDTSCDSVVLSYDLFWHCKFQGAYIYQVVVQIVEVLPVDGLPAFLSLYRFEHSNYIYSKDVSHGLVSKKCQLFITVKKCIKVKISYSTLSGCTKGELKTSHLTKVTNSWCSASLHRCNIIARKSTCRHHAY